MCVHCIRSIENTSTASEMKHCVGVCSLCSERLCHPSLTNWNPLMSVSPSPPQQVDPLSALTNTIAVIYSFPSVPTQPIKAALLVGRLEGLPSSLWVEGKGKGTAPLDGVWVCLGSSLTIRAFKRHPNRGNVAEQRMRYIQIYVPPPAQGDSHTLKRMCRHNKSVQHKLNIYNICSWQ